MRLHQLDLIVPIHRKRPLLRAGSAKPEVFQSVGKFGIFSGHIFSGEEENPTIAQVVQLLVAGRIGTAVDHWMKLLGSGNVAERPA